MFTPTRLVFLLTATLSVVAMPSHFARNAHNHRDLAARVALPQVATAHQVAARDMSTVERRMRKKRAGTGRCQPPATEDPKPTSSSSTSNNDPQPTETPEPTPTPDPTPTPTPTPDPTPTPTPTPDPAPSPSPTPTPDPGNGGGNGGDTGGGQTYSGQATFYATGLGACGITNNDGDDIAAVSHDFFDSYPGANGNPNQNPLCGKTAKVTLRGKTVYVKLTDRCEACAYGDLDFSPHAFDQIADPSEGRVAGMTWQIVG